jgi:two-component system response regulator HydG
VNLQEAVRDGKFRDDLYYRLNVVTMYLPPLRERREDIPLLVRHFLERTGNELRKEVSEVSEGGLSILMQYDWPGNVRELENAIERAIITCKTKILAEEDFAFLGHGSGGHQSWEIPKNMTLDEVEKQVIVSTLQRTQGNIKEAASLLGIDRSTLYDRIKKYQLPR